ncbi:MAG: hypothetical protein ABIQ66_07235, partial [Novosphingobium sp.]
MTAALSRKYPGIVVKSVAIRDVIKGACTKVRIALETNQPDFPKTVMMKAGFEPHSPDMGVMHEREHLSYSDLVPTLDVETATLHFSDVAEDGRA